MANATFPTFTGTQGENANNFLDKLEIACFISKQDDDASRVQVFPLLLKMEARLWHNALPQLTKDNWQPLWAAFEQQFGMGTSSERLWQLLSGLKQEGLGDYASYESKFVDLWGWWIAALRPGEVALDLLKKEKFMARLWPSLSEKVRGRFPVDYEEAVEVARLKDKKLCLQAQSTQPQQQGEGARPTK